LKKIRSWVSKLESKTKKLKNQPGKLLWSVDTLLHICLFSTFLGNMSKKTRLYATRKRVLHTFFNLFLWLLCRENMFLTNFSSIIFGLIAVLILYFYHFSYLVPYFKLLDNFGPPIINWRVVWSDDEKIPTSMKLLEKSFTTSIPTYKTLLTTTRIAMHNFDHQYL
jgi:hypothetical protein